MALYHSLSASNSRYKLAEILIDKNADPNERCLNGTTALCLVVAATPQSAEDEAGLVSVFQKLVLSGADTLAELPLGVQMQADSDFSGGDGDSGGNRPVANLVDYAAMERVEPAALAGSSSLHLKR